MGIFKKILGKALSVKSKCSISFRKASLVKFDPCEHLCEVLHVDQSPDVYGPVRKAQRHFRGSQEIIQKTQMDCLKTI